ncbi:murein biosynthesis integral membrane protein MurJ [Entomospira entomophila]|uniref:Probable lipid II flippase MurJ n=1 Tax=Entomospira entomophila TaxID=2719988 RepID=A0A968G8R5_9SPIO|nr:murein biosynthesis integral membrane protein MurJ [Entomospira entomophilus]NIZ40012.1 murein biosynthesis integral membrane protein MurJ [Entomospira entomophilus]WDI35572.1 murein biosynthesis integral membrane protein MurJ [Entomospira entomophilus]
MDGDSLTQRTKKRNLATLIVMGSTLVTRILGFLKFAVIAQYFGGSGVADVLNAVFTIPNNLRKLMAEGALTTAFIPSLSKHVVRSEREEAVRITRQVISVQYIVLIPFIIVSIVAASSLVQVFVDFNDPQKLELAAHLYRWFIPYLLLISVAAIIMAVLNTHERFLVSALSPLLFSIAVIAAIIFLAPTWGVYSMVIGVLLGGVGQVIIQYPLFHRLGYRIWPYFDFHHPEFHVVLKRYFPALLTSSIFVVNQQIAIFLATKLVDGSVSALSYAVVFFQLPFGIFSATVNTVFYPELAKYGQSKQYEAMGDSLKRGLHLLMIFLVPSAFLMILLSKEIIGVALMRGQFTVEATIMTATTLSAYSLGMFFIAAYNFIQRYFYAKGHFRIPLISALIACTIDVLLSLLLIRTPLGVAGLAYANSIAFFLAFMILMVLVMRERTMRIERDTYILMGKILFSILVGYGVYLGITHFIGNTWWLDGYGFMINVGLLILQGGIPALIILIMYILLEVDMIKDFIRRKRRR